MLSRLLLLPNLCMACSIYLKSPIFFLYLYLNINSAIDVYEYLKVHLIKMCIRVNMDLRPCCNKAKWKKRVYNSATIQIPTWIHMA